MNQASDPGVWAAFHRAWSACVGTSEYDKSVWIKAERQLLIALGGKHLEPAGAANDGPAMHGYRGATP